MTPSILSRNMSNPKSKEFNLNETNENLYTYPPNYSMLQIHFWWKKFSTTKRVISLDFRNLTRCLAANTFCKAFMSA